MTYKIVRFYARGDKEHVKSGLTLQEAQTHCSDPETSSDTATSVSANSRTAKKGKWFEGYDKE